MFKSKIFFSLILSLIFTSLFFFACSKDDNKTTESVSIIGTWKILKVTTTDSSGNTDVIVPADSGYTLTVTFNSDGSFITKRITDTVETDTLTWSKSGNKIIIDNVEYSYSIVTNMLTLICKNDINESVKIELIKI